jgi:hypothetical protein
VIVDLVTGLIVADFAAQAKSIGFDRNFKIVGGYPRQLGC